MNVILRLVGIAFLVMGLAIIGLGIGVAWTTEGLVGIGKFFSIDNTRNWIMMLMTLTPAIIFLIIARRLDHSEPESPDKADD